MSSTDIELAQDALPLIRLSERETWANELIAWAAGAQKAHEIATVLSETSFVPKSMQHRPGDVTGVILTAMELNVPIMWALANYDLVEGVPAIRAKALRGLLIRAGHEIWVEESTATRAVVCAKHRGSSRIEKSVWTLDRAKKAELLGKKNWRLYPQDMLLNRATAEAARLAAPDVLLGGYTVDELGGDEEPAGGMAVAEEQEQAPAPKKRAARRQQEPPPVEPDALPADIPAPPAEGHLGGLLPATCDLNMPHDIRQKPYGCPPNCPTRVAAEAAADAEAIGNLNAAGLAAEPIEGVPGVVDVQLPDEDMPPDDGEPMVSEGQRKRMAVEMRKAGIVDRQERLSFVSDVVGREVQSGNDLTMREASRVIDAVIAYGTEKGLAAVEPTGVPDAD